MAARVGSVDEYEHALPDDVRYDLLARGVTAMVRERQAGTGR